MNPPVVVLRSDLHVEIPEDAGYPVASGSGGSIVIDAEASLDQAIADVSELRRVADELMIELIRVKSKSA